MSLLLTFASGFIAWGMVQLGTPRLLKSCAQFNNCRAPDQHHSPRSPVSRLGGLSLAAAYFAIEWLMFLADDEEIKWGMDSLLVNSAPLAMFALGFWDDLKRLSAITKLAWQLLIASAVGLSGIGIQCLELPGFAGIISQPAWETTLTILWLVTCTNAINLVDGVDGLAGSIGLILMAVLVFLNQGAQVCLLVGMAGAVLAFLRFNLSPARIYLGDGGAYFIGFQIGLFSIVGSQRACSAGPLMLVLLGLTLPLLDTALALARRGLRGLPFFRPDRNHLHHYLLETGMPPRRLVLWYCGFTLVLVAIGSPITLGLGRCLVPLALSGLALAIGLLRLMLRIGGWKTLKKAVGSSVAMRQEIAYALCLRTWLKHEAGRCSSVEELYADLKLAARRLGFTSVQLTLADGTRAWSQPACGPLLTTQHSLLGGALGMLALGAPRCRLSPFSARGRSGSHHKCGASCQPVFNDVRLIEILSELLAESWVEATRDWNSARACLRFDHSLPQTFGIARRRSPADPTQTRKPDSKKEHLFAPGPGLLGRAFGLAVCAALFGAQAAPGGEWPSSTQLQKIVLGIPRVELPATAANFVQRASSAERGDVTKAMVRAAGRVGSAVVPPVVGAIAKTIPEMAALAAGEAALELPAQACAIAIAAAAEAPAQTKDILLAVCQAVPGGYMEIALRVEHTVPGATWQIREALAAVIPEMRHAIPTNSPPDWPSASLSTLLDPATARTVPKRELARSGVRRASRDPLTHGPIIGPPFVPWSGTLTNIIPSTSGTVPTGGRNYARP